MDRSYLLNSYIADSEKNYSNMQDADNYLEQLKFRIKGSKTIEELKNEVSMFLFKNDVDEKIKDGLVKICNDFNENTDLYHALTYLEDFVSGYLSEKERDYNNSNDTVNEIKEELVDSAIKDLDDAGIKISGNKESVFDKIQSEDDVYKLKSNIDTTVEYFDERKKIIDDENQEQVEVSIDVFEDALDRPNTETVLETTLEEQEKSLEDTNSSNVEISNDGSIVLQGDTTNSDSMNFALMMTSSLVASKTDFNNEQKFDMKFIKNEQELNKFKIIYGNFPIINNLNNTMDLLVVSKIQEVINSYNANIDYSQLLQQSSPELATSFKIISEHILNEPGAFQMAVKNGGKKHELIFAMDENYSEVSNAFSESGAMVSHDAMEHSIVRVNESSLGEQLIVLSSTLGNLNQKQLEQMQNQNGLQNQYQKQLVYPNNINEAANASRIFLTVVAFAEIALLTFFFYFIFS